MVKNACQRRRLMFSLWFGKIPWRRKWQPTPVFLLGKAVDRETWRAIVHGVAKESDTTQQLNNSNTIEWRF